MIPVELRVHGASGTPPEAMLYTGPVSYDLGARSAKVYERHLDHFSVKAFHWGSLTAGGPHTALWILLAPFAMANVAGWMSDRANPWTRALNRVAGLALTGVFFAQVANMTLHIPFETRLRRLEQPEPWSALLFALTAALTLVGLAVISAQSHFDRLSVAARLRLVFSPIPRHMIPVRGVTDPEVQWADPAEGVTMISAAMWSPHAVVHRLRRLHLSAGGFVLALVVGAGIGHDILVRGSIAGLLFTVFLVLATTWTPKSFPLGVFPTSLLPLATLGWLVYATIVIASANLTGRLTAADDVTFAFALILVVVALFALFGEWVKGGPGTGWASLGVLAIALLVGASLGLTGGLLVEDFLSPSPGLRTFARGGAWTALVMAGLTGLLVVVAILIALVPAKPAGERPPAVVAPESRLLRVIMRARSLLSLAGVYGLLAGIATALAACAGGPGCDRTRFPIPAWASEDAAGVVELSGLSFDFTSLLGWIKLVVVVLPALLILRSIVGGLVRGQEARRKVSIVWDIGSFWPRWFHPLGPPAYGPNAVTRLTEEISARSPQVLSAHSQGSLIAAVALTRAAGDARPDLFLTYGSPLGVLYPRLFPSAGLVALFESASETVEERWINLWRRSDPIGGRPLASLGERNWHVDSGSGHSRYELTDEYCSARESGLEGNLHRPPDTAMSACWERLADTGSGS